MDRAGLEKIFRDEPADSNAAAREDELRDRVKKLGGDAGASITALSCKARLCRIEFTFESPEALDLDMGVVAGPGAPLSYGSVAGSIFGPERPGDLRITFFRWHTAPSWMGVTTRQIGASSSASAAPDASRP